MPGAVVGGAGAQVPAIDVPADDHDLVGLLGAGDLGDGVVHLDLAGAEGVLHVDLDLDRPALEQPPDQAVGLGGQERLGDLGLGEVARGGGHVDQAVLLVGVAEDAGDPLGDQELLELLAELHQPGEVAHPPPHLAVQVGLGVLGRGLDGDLGEQDPGPLELPLVGAELVGGLGLDVDHRPALRALGRRAPAGRFQEDALLDRDDDPALGLAAGPGPLDHPRLDVGVGQPVLPELVPGPVIGLVQARRAGQPRPDHVAEILDVGHQLRALVDLFQDRLGDGLGLAAGLRDSGVAPGRSSRPPDCSGFLRPRPAAAPGRLPTQCHDRNERTPNGSVS